MSALYLQKCSAFKCPKSTATIIVRHLFPVLSSRAHVRRGTVQCWSHNKRNFKRAVLCLRTMALRRWAVDEWRLAFVAGQWRTDHPRTLDVGGAHIGLTVCRSVANWFVSAFNVTSFCDVWLWNSEDSTQGHCNRFMIGHSVIEYRLF